MAHMGVDRTPEKTDVTSRIVSRALDTPIATAGQDRYPLPHRPGLMEESPAGRWAGCRVGFPSPA